MKNKGKKKVKILTAAEDFNQHLNLNSNLNLNNLSRAYNLSIQSDSPFYFNCSNQYSSSFTSTSTANPLPVKSESNKLNQKRLDQATKVTSGLSPRQVTDQSKVIKSPKGKGKEVIIETSTTNDNKIFPVCSSAKCAKNPKCLNYLGQDKWEDVGKRYHIGQ